MRNYDPCFVSDGSHHETFPSDIGSEVFVDITPKRFMTDFVTNFYITFTVKLAVRYFTPLYSDAISINLTRIKKDFV